MTPLLCSFFFFNDTATTEIYTLSLHDALPICHIHSLITAIDGDLGGRHAGFKERHPIAATRHRSEEHTSELQSLAYLVCRLLLEKKKKKAETIADYSLIFTNLPHQSIHALRRP